MPYMQRLQVGGVASDDTLSGSYYGMRKDYGWGEENTLFVPTGLESIFSSLLWGLATRSKFGLAGAVLRHSALFRLLQSEMKRELHFLYPWEVGRGHRRFEICIGDGRGKAGWVQVNPLLPGWTLVQRSREWSGDDEREEKQRRRGLRGERESREGNVKHQCEQLCGDTRAHSFWALRVVNIHVSSSLCFEVEDMPDVWRLRDVFLFNDVMQICSVIDTEQMF